MSSHTHFYDSDYTVHHRPSHAVFVHAVSDRTLGTECLNQENKRGRMMADGVTTIYSRGDQYESVFPLLNFTLLPGTTEVQSIEQDDESSDHECEHIGNGDIRRRFAGGVSEGGVGASAMDFARAQLQAAAVPAAAGDDDDRSPVCRNASAAEVGKHCDISKPIRALGNALIENASACEERCCGTYVHTQSAVAC